MTVNKWLFRLLLVSAICGQMSCGLLKQEFGTSKTSHTGTHSSNKELRLRNNIVSFAKEHVGTGYRYGGKSPTGFDCSGFVSFVLDKYNVSVSGPSASQENQGKKIRSTDAQPGDLVFFRRSKTGRVFHVAMVYENKGGNLTVIHSTSGRGVVIDDISESSYWKTKYVTLRDVVSP